MYVAKFHFRKMFTVLRTHLRNGIAMVALLRERSYCCSVKTKVVPTTSRHNYKLNTVVLLAISI